MTIDPLEISIKQNTPAPGQYGRGIEINKLGLYSLSTVRNSLAQRFSPAKQRFQQIKVNETPGPGGYNPSDYSHGGSYILSNHRNTGTA